jgi:aspartyl-tRNA(Asn)/glutamyl-tRNA(Gln) amidotransferase subunit A
MTNLTDLIIASALEGLKNKDFSAVELTKAHITAMENARDLNCFITETPDIALKQAEAADVRYANGTNLPLDGIPIGMKDLFCTDGTQTTAASHILEGFIPQYESTVSGKLWDAGCTMLGKLNLDEFAMGTSNESSYFGNVISPWKRNNDDSDLVPGGSSGGSSAAVSARLCLGATGTDTGGSIRQPAAFTGVCGIRPTYGRCSRWGIVAFASSLDQAGVFARTVEDTAVLLETISGYDPKDSTSSQIDVPEFSKNINANMKGKKIGIPKEYRIDGLSDDIQKYWDKTAEWLKDQGAQIIDISLPHTKYALPAYYIINPAEASSNLARYDGIRYGLRETGEDLRDLYELTRAKGFGEEVKRRIMVGTYALSAGYYDAYYLKAQKVRRLVQNDFLEAFEKVDAIVTPTAPTTAFGIGEIVDDPVSLYLQDIFTVTLNMAGLPGMSVPVGLDSQGLPIGIQVIGKHFDEQEVFNVARGIERAANFTAKPQILGLKDAA